MPMAPEDITKVLEGEWDTVKSELLESIVSCAKEVFCGGIYVPCSIHPCGWDFINFENIGLGEVMTREFELYDISGGIYDTHPFEYATLASVLVSTRGNYAFEISGINW